jgi:preprotein translocase subunit SecE
MDCVSNMADATKPKTSPLQFLREVRAEARKVTWATRNETMISTVFVLIMVALAALFFYAVDGLLRMGAAALYG